MMDKIVGNSKTLRILLASAIVITALSGCGGKVQPSVPEELVGKWKTSAPEYADRFFKLGKGSLSFGIGEGKTELYFIKQIEKVYEKGSTLFTLYYENVEGEEYQISFYYNQTEGVVRLKNQKEMAWRKG
jgi:hypothetical protein